MSPTVSPSGSLIVTNRDDVLVTRMDTWLGGPGSSAWNIEKIKIVLKWARVNNRTNADNQSTALLSFTEYYTVVNLMTKTHTNKLRKIYYSKQISLITTNIFLLYLRIHIICIIEYIVFYTGSAKTCLNMWSWQPQTDVWPRPMVKSTGGRAHTNRNTVTAIFLLNMKPFLHSFYSHNDTF